MRNPYEILAVAQDAYLEGRYKEAFELLMLADIKRPRRNPILKERDSKCGFLNGRFYLGFSVSGRRRRYKPWPEHWKAFGCCSLSENKTVSLINYFQGSFCARQASTYAEFI